jgi:hypothetical protein
MAEEIEVIDTEVKTPSRVRGKASMRASGESAVSATQTSVLGTEPRMEGGTIDVIEERQEPLIHKTGSTVLDVHVARPDYYNEPFENGFTD